MIAPLNQVPASELYLYVDDPTMAPKDAAAYLGISPRTLRKLRLERSPMAGTGLKWGYRRSTLNRHMKKLAQQYGAFSTRSVLSSDL